jgi:Holliday junction resolvasome RuvABC endonuclease subunit
MVQALLSLGEPPSPPDAADALAVALCHALKRGTLVALAKVGQ